jgi:hypothetical protein
VRGQGIGGFKAPGLGQHDRSLDNRLVAFEHARQDVMVYYPDGPLVNDRATAIGIPHGPGITHHASLPPEPVTPTVEDL